MTKDIIEGNILIADFAAERMSDNWIPESISIALDKSEKSTVMGGARGEWRINEKPFVSAYQLKYHESWDWLMPCIRKAKASPNSSEWDWTILNSYLLRCEIDIVWSELCDFIKWYNATKNN